MNRREMLGGLGALALTSACGGSAPKPAQNAKGLRALGAVPAGMCLLRIEFIGLCVFIKDVAGQKYDVGLLDPTSVKDPDGNPFKAHTPIVLIDQKSSMGGTDFPDADIKALRLLTDYTLLKKHTPVKSDLVISGLTPGIVPLTNLAGAVPVRFLYPGRIPSDWAAKNATVQSAIALYGGRLASGIPRDSGGIERRPWKFGLGAADEPAWKEDLHDVPRLLSDTVQFETIIPVGSKIVLRDRTTKTEQEIATAADQPLEMWVINLPAKDDHTPYEMSHHWESQHTRAFYQLFDPPPAWYQLLVPIANPKDFPSGDPVYCPPGGD